MIKNYLKLAWRTLLRYKSNTFINVVGLSIGIASCLLIFLVIRFEESFDQYHKNKNAIYRVVSANYTPEGRDYTSGVPFPVANGLRIDHPELTLVAAIFRSGDEQVTIVNTSHENSTPYKEKIAVYYTEPDFFAMFDFSWLAGDPGKALKEPNTVVLSRKTAIRYFGDWKNAIGKTILHDNIYLLKVTGILEDVPVNSDFPLEVVISYSTLKNTQVSRNLNDWISTWSGSYCFVMLPQQVSEAKFNSYLADFVKKHKPAEYVKDALMLQPLSTIHSDERFGNFADRTFSKELISAFTLIGIFLLVIACVNFINLSTSQAVNRAKEVAVRKVLGGYRNDLVMQFMGETGLITLIAVSVAIGMAIISLPFLNTMLSISLSPQLLITPATLLFLVVVFIAVTFLSGFYPALVLSGFSPIQALKSRVAIKASGGISLRRLLVVLQFSIAQALIIGTLVVVSQMNYFRNASLGFDKESIVNVSIPGDSVNHARLEYMRHQLLQQPGIENVSFSYGSPSDNSNWQSDLKYDNDPKNSDFSVNLKWADTAYFRTYGLEVIAGRIYAPGDTVREFVVNEAFLKKVGVTNPGDIIGKKLDFWDGRMVANIVGVIKDFHSFSLREPVAPVVMGTFKRAYAIASIRVSPTKTKTVMSYVENLWNTTFPNEVFSYEFLDQKIDGFYRQENQLAQLYKVFACIAIFISCLGLYGLISFMTVHRTKEVGIRKVLGASVSHIVYLLSKEFTLLILLAFVISMPVAWYVMQQWLEKFTFRIHFGIGIFLTTVAASVAIAWVTVGYRTISAAVANPVKNLRTE